MAAVIGRSYIVTQITPSFMVPLQGVHEKDVRHAGNAYHHPAGRLPVFVLSGS